MRRKQYAFEGFIVDDLKRYELYKKALVSIPEEIKTLEAQITSIKSANAEKEVVSGGENNREEMLLNNIAKRTELKRQFAITKSNVELTDKSLESLSDEEMKILDRFFIHPAKGNVDRLCEELGYEKTRVYELKDETLLKVGMARYGVLRV